MTKLLEVTPGLIAIRNASGDLRFSSENPIVAKLDTLSVPNQQLTWPEPDFFSDGKVVFLPGIGNKYQRTNDIDRSVKTTDVTLGSAPTTNMDMIWGRIRVVSLDQRGESGERLFNFLLPIGIWSPLIGSSLTEIGFDDFSGGDIFLTRKFDILQTGGNFVLRLTTSSGEAFTEGPFTNSAYPPPDMETKVTVDIEIAWGKFVDGE